MVNEDEEGLLAHSFCSSRDFGDQVTVSTGRFSDRDQVTHLNSRHAALSQSAVT